MRWGHIWVGVVDPFKKQFMFVFNLQTRLTCLAYKYINFYYYFVIIAYFIIVIICFFFCKL